MTGDEIDEFSFDMFDANGSGTLNVTELKEALLKIHGKSHIEGKLKPILEIMDKNHDQIISKNEYMKHVKAFPALVFPVFSIQVIKF